MSLKLTTILLVILVSSCLVMDASARYRRNRRSSRSHSSHHHHHQKQSSYTNDDCKALLGLITGMINGYQVSQPVIALVDGAPIGAVPLDTPIPTVTYASGGK